MDVVYGINENYAAYAAVSIVSLFENQKDTDIRVFVLGDALSDESREKLMSLGDSSPGPGFTKEVSVINTADFADRLSAAGGGDRDYGKFSRATMLRLLIPDYLPGDTERFLYMDADTLVLSSLGGLFRTDMGEDIVMMAPEPTMYIKAKKELGFGADEAYYNAGVMLANRRLWEAEDLSGRCLSLIKERPGATFFDQDILNLALKGRIGTLPQRFNFFTNYHYRSYESLTKLSPWFEALTDRASYEEARLDPAVVHFAGDERPWYRGNFNPYRREYEKYLALSPWTGRESVRGHEAYMLFYHFVNLLTGAAPAARDRISGHYYEKTYGHSGGSTEF